MAISAVNPLDSFRLPMRDGNFERCKRRVSRIGVLDYLLGMEIIPREPAIIVFALVLDYL